MRSDCDREAATDYFEFLDELRASGTTNMFGARPVLMQQFGLDGELAKSVLAAWMETYKRNVSVSDRVAQAYT